MSEGLSKLDGNQQNLHDSPHHGATKARVSLEHIDAATNPLERAIDFPHAGRFESERPVEREEGFDDVAVSSGAK